MLDGIKNPPCALPTMTPTAPAYANEAGGVQSETIFEPTLLPMKALFAVSACLRRVGRGTPNRRAYGVNDWRNIPFDDNVNRALSHLMAFVAGDHGELHLVNAACRVLFALEQYAERHPEVYEDAAKTGVPSFPLVPKLGPEQPCDS